MLPFCRPARQSLGALSLMVMALPAAHASDSLWSLRVGPAHVGFDAKSSVEVAGTPVPGSFTEVEDSTILASELAYRTTDRRILRMTLGAPLAGTLGKVKYDLAVASAAWNLWDFVAAHRLARNIQAGTLFAGTQLSFDLGIPFGGYKQSGWGRENGEYLFAQDTETKSVIVKL
jgi:hypothetical protein